MNKYQKCVHKIVKKSMEVSEYEMRKEKLLKYDEELDYKKAYPFIKREFNAFMNEARKDYKRKDAFEFMLQQKEECKNYIIANNIKL